MSACLCTRYDLTKAPRPEYARCSECLAPVCHFCVVTYTQYKVIYQKVNVPVDTLYCALCNDATKPTPTDPLTRIAIRQGNNCETIRDLMFKTKRAKSANK